MTLVHVGAVRSIRSVVVGKPSIDYFRLLRFGQLVVGAQAPRADIDPLGFPVNLNCGGVNIGVERPLGMDFGVANRMPEEGTFAAHVALQCSLLL